MQVNRKGDVFGYVKVEVRCRSPKLWSWSLFQEGSDKPIERSDELFKHAEDAWKSGQSVINQFKPAARQAA